MPMARLCAKKTVIIIIGFAFTVLLVFPVTHRETGARSAAHVKKAVWKGLNIVLIAAIRNVTIHINYHNSIRLASPSRIAGPFIETVRDGDYSMSGDNIIQRPVGPESKEYRFSAKIFTDATLFRMAMSAMKLE
jgi:hypothetical protein